MGNDICCSEKEHSSSRIKISVAKKINSDEKIEYVRPETSSTSDSDTENRFPPAETLRPQKSDNFKNYFGQRSFEISSIKKISQSCADCCQQKLIISYLQRRQKELEAMEGQNNMKLQEIHVDREQKYKFDEKRFIQHSSKCPICYELFQNLKNLENQESLKSETNVMESRISLRDSLLESEQCEKAKRCEECKCQVLSSHEEAKKAMIKFPNTNKYQSKRLKFRKTSLFQPQIKEARQSEQSIQNE